MQYYSRVVKTAVGRAIIRSRQKPKDCEVFALIQIIGAGLAGSEAAYQLAKRGYEVRLVDMKPEKMSPAHTLPGPAELVCSNSLGSDAIGSAGAMLKAELRILDCLILKAAQESAVPAGSALAVDREKMSRAVKSHLAGFPNLFRATGEVTEFSEGDAFVATGPLTSPALAEKIETLVGRRLSFYDATSPIVAGESIDREKVYAASRYGKGDPDYLNCPMTRDEYMAFIRAVAAADLVTPHDFEDFSVFEGCMPIEQIVSRGELTLAYGPLRPVGLPDPRTGKIPFAVVQLRKEDLQGDSYNLVGFQTRMTFGEQKRIFRMIPGLEQAEFHRFGVMHRNMYIDSRHVLDSCFRLKNAPHLRFIGQITGVEGYMESTAIGLLGALFYAHENLSAPPEDSMLGALCAYVTRYGGKDFQPMAANFGLLPPLDKRIPKKLRKEQYHLRGVNSMKEWAAKNGL